MILPDTQEIDFTGMRTHTPDVRMKIANPVNSPSVYTRSLRRASRIAEYLNLIEAKMHFTVNKSYIFLEHKELLTIFKAATNTIFCSPAASCIRLIKLPVLMDCLPSFPFQQLL